MLHRTYKLILFEGWCREKQGRWYAEQVSKIRDGIIVEIGVYQGMSISYILDTCLAQRNIIYAIDPWELANPDEDPMEFRNCRLRFKEIIDQLQVTDTVRILQMTSAQAVRHFEDESVDFVYIDGDHTCEAVTHDMHAWLQKLKPGATLAGDDYDWDSVREAVVAFTRERGIDFEVYDGTWYFTKW